MPIYMKTLITVALCFTIGITGCAVPGSENDQANDDEFDTVIQPIVEEVPARVERITNLYHLPNGARVFDSYAARPQLKNCSGAMISSNVLLSAAHCPHESSKLDRRPNSATASFRTYSNRDITTHTDEDFECLELLSTHSQSDTKLWYCEPNDSGENPGDKYGYLDISVFDNSSDGDGGDLSVGDELFKVWRNDIDDININDAVLFSTGEVLCKDQGMWFVPDGGAEGLRTSLWARSGGSGAATINPATRRLAAGPTSTASSGTQTCSDGNTIDYDGHGANMLSMHTTMKYSKVIDGVGDGSGSIWYFTLINKGLDPYKYDDEDLDSDKSGLFDLLVDIQDKSGLGKRAIFWLGFDSPIRNTLWWQSDSAVIRPDREFLYWPQPDSSEAEIFGLSRKHFELTPNEPYRVTVTIRTEQTSDPKAVRMYWANDYITGSYDFETDENAGWQTQSVIHTADEEPEDFWFKDYGTSELYVAALSISHIDAIWDFDSQDARFAWKNENNGRQALMTTDGNARPDQSGANWAGVVQRDRSLGSEWNDWSLRNARLGLLSNQAYGVCFDVRNNAPADPLSSRHKGAVRVRTGTDTNVLLESFPLSDEWANHCFRFHTVDGPSNLMFGINADKSVAGTSADEGSFLIDNVVIDEAGM